ncbi:MAG: hypothetical protein JSS86_25740 [Cyanobacteria bacterium SZAS LIN-2]|nr:hypothetical protein [Cyanobacteria bacterium SZAS LIN-2]
MARIFRQELYNLAQIAQHETLAYRPFEQPFDASHLNGQVYALACRARGVDQMSNGEILPTFFSAEATAYLMTMPNIYWLWTAIKGAVLCDDSQDDDTKISLKAVKDAISRLRTDLAYKYDLRQALTELTPAQLCSRTTIGVVLVRSKPFDLDEIIVNPLFAPESLNA